MEENQNVNVDEETQDTEVKTYTQEEVLSLIQSEADKRVTQALKKQQTKFEQKLSLSQLDEQSRAEAEKDIKIQELQEQLSQFNRMQTKNEVLTVLTDRGLNPKFADLIEIGEDVEEAQAKIDTLDKLFKAEVKKQVESRLGSTTPKNSTVGLTGEITKEQFVKMSLAEQSALYQNNKELYTTLTKK